MERGGGEGEGGGGKEKEDLVHVKEEILVLEFYDLVIGLFVNDDDKEGKEKDDGGELFGTAAAERINQYFDSLTTASEKEKAKSCLVDIIWLLEMEFEGPTDKKRKRLARFINNLFKESIISDELLCERLEPEILEEAGILLSAVGFNKKQVRINTSMLYKQQKFNLLREESEGFAKVITVLTGENATGEAMYQQLVTLIGYFDLDPNRILDLIIDIFAFNVHDRPEAFEVLLRKFAFPPTTIANIVGFKLLFLGKQQQDGQSSQKGLEGLMLCLAKMIKLDFCPLEAIYPHLCPLDDEQVSSEIQTISDQIKNHHAMAKSSKPAPASSSSSTSPMSLAMEHQPAVHDVCLEINMAASSITNQKILLTAMFLKTDELGHARLLLEKFPGIGIVPIIASNICAALHRLLLLTIDDDDKSWEIVMPILLTWLDHLKGGLYMDVLLMVKICRLGRRMLMADQSHCNQWLWILNSYLLPALTVVQANPALDFEIWELLKFYPYTTRYGLYGQWRAGLYDLHPASSLAKSIVLSDIRRVMRRLTKENVRQYGRLIAKLCHSNPIIVFPIILEQLQAYDNLIQPVVDALKYLTPLGFDVLSFVLIDCLANPIKDRLKEDGTNLSSWLQGLALFTGSLFRRYFVIAEPLGILQYLGKQLLDDSSFDLGVLSELLYRMGGIERTVNISEAHIEAHAGGPLLKAEVTLNETLQTQLKVNKKAVNRLMSVLVNNGLAIPFWILLGQQRKTVILTGDHSHVKLLAMLLDSGREVQNQYCELISIAIKEGLIVDQNLLPSLEELIEKFSIDHDVAFTMRRAWCRSFSSISIINEHSITMDLNSALDSSSSNNAVSISKGLKNLFWYNELSDIHCPVDRYYQESMRLKTILSSPVAVTNTGTSSSSPHGINKAMELTRWKKDRERAPQTILALEAELKSQQIKVETFLKNINPDEDLKIEMNMLQLFRSVLLPRAIDSPADAIYVSKFVWLLLYRSSVGGNFHLPLLMDKMIGELKNVLAMLTEYEAHNFARFLELILCKIMNLHYDEAKWKEIAHLPGASRPPSTLSPILMDGEGGSGGGGDKVSLEQSSITTPNNNTSMIEPLSFEDFRHLTYKWHLKLHRVFVTSLESGDYLPIKNSIIVLTKIATSFPILKKIGFSIQKAIGKVREEKREDLKVMATRYSAMLMLNENKWIQEEEFHHVPNSRIEIGEITESLVNDQNIIATPTTTPTTATPIITTITSSTTTPTESPDRKRQASENGVEIPPSKRSTTYSSRKDNKALMEQPSLSSTVPMVARTQSPRSYPSSSGMNTRRGGGERFEHDRSEKILVNDRTSRSIPLDSSSSRGGGGDREIHQEMERLGIDRKDRNNTIINNNSNRPRRDREQDSSNNKNNNNRDRLEHNNDRDRERERERERDNNRDNRQRDTSHSSTTGGGADRDRDRDSSRQSQRSSTTRSSDRHRW